MNILLLNWRDPKNPRAGGAEYVTMKHAMSWVAAGHAVTWLATSFPGGKNTEIINGVSIVRRGKGVSLFFYVPYFYKTAKKKYDLVIDEIHGIPFFTPLYVRGPIIAFIHEVAGEIWDYIYPFPINHIGRFIEKASLLLYRNVPFWTDAPSTIDELEVLGIKRKMCTTIPCPIDNPPLVTLPKKEQLPTFIFVGRLVRMKGADDAILAFALLKNRLKGARLWIVGYGEKSYVKKLKQRVYELHIASDVRFFEFVPSRKKFALMRKAHILLHPSVKEGWGLVVLEAASQATPTLAYNVSGLKDTVKDGRTGFLLSRSPQEMAQKAVGLYEDKKKYLSMQKHCLKFVGSFSWTAAEGQSIQLLESVLRQAR